MTSSLTKPHSATLFLLASLFLALGFSTSSCKRRASAGEGEPLEATVTKAIEKELPAEVSAAGSIEAVDKAEVAFLVSGRIVSVDVEDGADVVEGQVLARLDDGDYRQMVAAAEAKLAEVRARHERLSKLRTLGSLTPSDFDKIESGLREAEASAELARRQLGYTTLKAPFAGRVVKRIVAAGQVAVPSVPVFTVLAPAPVWANVGVAEAEAQKVRVGQPALVSLPATGDKAQAGKVDAVLPQADPLSRSFTVKIGLKNEEGLLHPGNVVTARITVGASRRACLLQPKAVQRHPDGSLFVWLVEPKSGKAVRKIVETGSLNGSLVEISKGLAAGDAVILEVPLTLFEGMPVKAVFAK